MKKNFRFAFLLIASTLAQASGVITVRGKLVSITRTDYVIETPSQVFRIKRSAVPPVQASQLERTEIQVAVTVPFKDIDSVTSRPRAEQKITKTN